MIQIEKIRAYVAASVANRCLQRLGPSGFVRQNKCFGGCTFEKVPKGERAKDWTVLEGRSGPALRQTGIRVCSGLRRLGSFGAFCEFVKSLNPASGVQSPVLVEGRAQLWMLDPRLWDFYSSATGSTSTAVLWSLLRSLALRRVVISFWSREAASGGGAISSIW
jgi:hypothetical protein